MLSSARLKANEKYHAKFDDIKIRVPLGQREQIKAYAESQGKSLNSYINELIQADMLAHGYKSPEPASQAETAEDS